MNIYKITGYKTNKDYSKLWELAKSQSVICICDYGENSRDVSHTIADENGCQVSERGTCFVSANSISNFIEQCRQCNLEWIEPNDNNALAAEPNPREISAELPATNVNQ